MPSFLESSSDGNKGREQNGWTSATPEGVAVSLNPFAASSPHKWSVLDNILECTIRADLANLPLSWLCPLDRSSPTPLRAQAGAGGLEEVKPVSSSDLWGISTFCFQLWMVFSCRLHKEWWSSTLQGSTCTTCASWELVWGWNVFCKQKFDEYLYTKATLIAKHFNTET